MTPLMVVLILVGCVVPSSAHEVFVALSDVNHGAYRLEGHFVVEAPRHVVWEVLTDYDHIREFVSSIRTSQVKQRDKDWLLLEQDAVGRVLFFWTEIFCPAGGSGTAFGTDPVRRHLAQRF
ncbi:MAG: hypothetical protein HYZ73_07585 [Elusimicrobia bacterium]|nr:hypothetical protein [Elusimicrobiota bacterium]